MTKDELPHITGVYRHYKGNEYLVIDITLDADTLEHRITYVDEKSTRWSRRLHGLDPKTGNPSGWADPLPDGRERFTRI